MGEPKIPSIPFRSGSNSGVLGVQQSLVSGIISGDNSLSLDFCCLPAPILLWLSLVRLTRLEHRRRFQPYKSETRLIDQEGSMPPRSNATRRAGNVDIRKQWVDIPAAERQDYISAVTCLMKNRLRATQLKY
ncbi:hypothetical protein EJ03DRAFT_138985 [Teratosphaeria nubilosa]|uniref:Uncharacterized protein n=1 Tax=Teratosphaeria nubilosa TaxID=161662 RepID=A0A6G1L5P6_9PEZI|nr:hypothetical protein EJ03DRAFT_138985 [Teratosphaeria nubilosa]